MESTPYKLKDWVIEEYLNSDLLTLNPNATHYIFNKILLNLKEVSNI